MRQCTGTAMSIGHRRRGFTLIETVISLSIMSVLMLGLSGAVMLGSKALPTATETGIADQVVIDSVNLLRADLRQATSIIYDKPASGDEILITLKDSGISGQPLSVLYEYDSEKGLLNRTVDSRGTVTLIEGLTGFSCRFQSVDNRAQFGHMLLMVEGTLKEFYEVHVTLPANPEYK